DLAIIVDAEVEAIHRAGRALHCQQNGVDTVVDVEIGFALMAVSKNTKLRRIVAQLSIEVHNVAVGVALAENRHEPEDPSLDAEAFRIGFDQAFAGQLRRSVERRLDGEWRVLRRGDYGGLAVDGPRRCERDAAYA